MKKLIAYIAPLLLLSGCEKALLDEDPENTPRANFESLWQTVKDKYSFFELKNINWDSVKSVYGARISEDMSDEELFAVLDSMLFVLRDGHVNLVSPFNLSRNWQWYLNSPPNFNEDLMEREYLGAGHRIAGGIRYTRIDSVGYVYYGSFSSGFSSQNLKAVVDYFSGMKGVILDVRDNGGGSLNNAFALAQRFIPSSQEVMITFEKTGPAPGDFGNGLSYSLSPANAGHFDGPVVILTNRKCYSATNSFVGMMSTYDHVTIIGDSTGGGGGLPVDQELPNGWRYRFSATASFLPDGYNIEQGIPPDIRLDLDTNGILQGEDNLIERGLREFR